MLLIAGQPIFLGNTGPFKEAVRIAIDKDGDFKFQVFLKTLFEGHVNYQSFSTYLDQMTERSDFSVCPEIKQSYLEVKYSLKKKPQKLKLGLETIELTALNASFGLTQPATQSNLECMYVSHVKHYYVQ